MYTLQVRFDNVYKYTKIFSNEEHEYEMSENVLKFSGNTMYELSHVFWKNWKNNQFALRTLPNSETTTVSLAFRESYTYMHVFCHKGDWRPLTLCKDLNRSLYPI